jgi:D-alanyl-D-alanine carboxypeptidase/D-alanyl-D-alanine-endopeptidase (penicillin-binding protein 4)
MANKIHLRPRAVIISACAALLIIFSFAAFRSFSELRGQAAVPAREVNKESSKSEAKPSTALSVSNTSSALELGHNIARAIDESEFARARWGIFVMSLRDGRVLYARDADKTFAPASNMKVYTTAVALDALGADYRWRTSIYAEAEPDKTGTIAGDLTLYGRGAPDFSSGAEKSEAKSSLDQLADELYKRGVRKVRGDIIGDESYFRGDALGDGWLWDDVQWYFGAEVSALTINGNEVNVAVTPSGKPGEAASIKLKPETSYIQIKNDANTIERGAPSSIGITRGLSDNEVRVWGDFPSGGSSINARLSVHQPALWAATLFREALRARGINVEGKTRAVDARDNRKDAKVDLEHAVELASVTSKTLGEVVHSANKESINLYAELILRTLGKERGATAPAKDPKKMRTRGDDEAGLAVIRQWLEKHDIATDAFALHDGSGLSRLDLVTPEATARLLAAITQTHAAQVFRDSLPVAGRDGTLKSRLRSSAMGRVVAKTGTLTYINSLSGYVTTGDDETLAFSIICNDDTTAESSVKVIDAIATLLASYRESGR